MIRRVRLRNFKRYADAELILSPEQQLVLIAGDNGVGKSTLLHAITWALYGEVPGIRIDQLVRRGADLEGMEVECEFTVAGVDYQVVRRRQRPNTFATLHAGGVAIMQGPKQVTAEISRIIGMDVAGFRMAVIAQQKELDALVRKTDAERSAVISRLLRLDVVTRAKEAARAQYNEDSKILTRLGKAPDVDEVRRVADEAARRADQMHLAEDDLRAAIADLDDQLALSDSIEQEYLEATQRASRAQGMMESASAEAARLNAEISMLPDDQAPPPPPRPLEDVLADQAQTERALGAAKTAEQQEEYRAMWQRELSSVQAQLEQLDAQLMSPTMEEMATQRARTTDQLATLSSSLESATEDLDAAREARAAAQARKDAAQVLLDRWDGVGGTCPTCDQPVSEEHRDRHLREQQEVWDRETAEVASLEERIAAAQQSITTLKSAVTDVQKQIQDAVTQAAEVEKVRQERDELARRAQTYRAQLDRVPAQEVHVDDLLERKGALALELAAVQEYHDACARHELGVQRSAELKRQLQAAADRVETARMELADAQMSEDLLSRIDHRQQLKRARAAESAALADVRTQAAVARRDAAAAQEAIGRAEAEHARRSEIRQSAAAAADAATLLDRTGKHLASTVRPALEGTVATILGQMSGGRFSRVVFDEKYTLKVDDAGTLVPVEELSGGEADLVALAVRLALAQVVVERHGAGGTGFLILDEVFGSQDATRREAIVAGLRALRSTYGQILMISHVPGLDDTADAVVTVDTGVDDCGERIAIATVSS